MSTKNIEFALGELKNIASDYGQPYLPGAQIHFITGKTNDVAPSTQEGKLWFALKDDINAEELQVGEDSVTLGRHRAYIFLDNNNKRYAITGPVNWSEIYNKPTLVKNIEFTDSSEGVNSTLLDSRRRYKRLVLSD